VHLLVSEQYIDSIMHGARIKCTLCIHVGQDIISVTLLCM